MTTSAMFIPLPGFTWVSGGRSVEVQFCDRGEEFRNCAEECQEIANGWGGELCRQYEDFPASGWCLRGSLISVVPLPDDPFACPPLDLPGAPQQHARGFIPRCPFRPSVDHFAPRNVRLQPLARLNSKGTNANDSPDATPIEAEARGHLAAQIGGALPAHYEGRAGAWQIWSCCPVWNPRRNKIDRDSWLFPP